MRTLTDAFTQASELLMLMKTSAEERLLSCMYDAVRLIMQRGHFEDHSEPDYKSVPGHTYHEAILHTTPADTLECMYGRMMRSPPCRDESQYNVTRVLHQAPCILRAVAKPP